MKTLLFVDDEEEILSLLGEFFGARGYEIAFARNGFEALSSVKAKDLGAIFLDLKMPDMDGVETLRLIREINPDVPVIIVSGHATEDLARKLLKEGAFDFVAKPVDLSRLQEIVKHLETLEEVRTPDRVS